MTSGAPAPGGPRAPAAGGMRMTSRGGTNLNDTYQNSLRSGYPDFTISVGDSSGARVVQSRSVIGVRKGRAQGALTYSWTLPTRPGGSTATATTPTAATAGFTPDVAGLYVFRVAVTFSDGTVITKEVKYTSA